MKVNDPVTWPGTRGQAGCLLETVSLSYSSQCVCGGPISDKCMWLWPNTFVCVCVCGKWPRRLLWPVPNTNNARIVVPHHLS